MSHAMEHNAEGAVFGVLGMVLAHVLGMIEVQGVLQAFVYGGSAALGGVVVKFIWNKIFQAFNQNQNNNQDEN